MVRKARTKEEASMMGRHVLEFKSRGAAGILDETEDWYWVRVLDAFEMYVHKQDKSVTPCLVQDGFWESWITQYVIDRIGPGTVFFDVGANTGYYALLANYYGAMVSAYEPNPAYHNMLQATIARQNVSRMPIRLSQTAISDKVGTETLYIPKELHGSASFTELDAKWETTPVEVKTDYLRVNGCGHYLIKIDAEGAEEKIWDGFVDDLKKRVGPSEVLLEYTPNAYSDSFIDKLESYAPLHWINHDAQRVPVSREWLLSQNDWVMLTLRPGKV
jgi:FkbM family methyltransferase